MRRSIKMIVYSIKKYLLIPYSDGGGVRGINNKNKKTKQ